MRLHFRTRNLRLEDDLLDGQVQRLGHVLKNKLGIVLSLTQCKLNICGSQ